MAERNNNPTPRRQPEDQGINNFLRIVAEAIEGRHTGRITVWGHRPIDPNEPEPDRRQRRRGSDNDSDNPRTQDQS